jgi:hypothetical protein
VFVDAVTGATRTRPLRAAVDRLVIKGSTWLYRSTFEYKGQSLTLRTWNRFSSADHYTFAAEISRD